MARITLSLTVNGPVTASTVKNAVRRSLDKTEFEGDTGTVNGVRYAVKHITPKGEATAVRAWAKEQGIPVGTRGRIAPDLYDAYLAAQVAE